MTFEAWWAEKYPEAGDSGLSAWLKRRAGEAWDARAQLIPPPPTHADILQLATRIADLVESWEVPVSIDWVRVDPGRMLDNDVREAILRAARADPAVDNHARDQIEKLLLAFYRT